MKGCRWAWFGCLVLAGCLSSAPPAAPVRWFDPLPAPAESLGAPTPRVACAVRMEAATHLGQDFAVRTAERELVFDSNHRWIAPPAALVAAALVQRLGVQEVPAERAVVLVVERFELVLGAAPKAVVRVRFVGSQPQLMGVAVEASAGAAGSGPALLAAAMAQALQTVADEVGKVLVGAGVPSK